MAGNPVIFLLPIAICAFACLVQAFKLSASQVLPNNLLEEKINALLPQTQCGKCDYDACRPYARAIARDETDINHCPPGGIETISQIASLLGRNTKPLQSDHLHQQGAQVAIIDETLCIGCVKCIQACPVDAIIGAAKQMHAIIEKACTGCELCLAPCPVNCISLASIHMEIKSWVWIKPGTNNETQT